MTKSDPICGCAVCSALRTVREVDDLDSLTVFASELPPTVLAVTAAIYRIEQGSPLSGDVEKVLEAAKTCDDAGSSWAGNMGNPT